MSLEQEIQSIHALMTEEDAGFLRLAQLLNEAVLHDFESVRRLLYRVDVSEKKVRATLQSANDPTNAAGGDAGTILARLLLDRVKEKAAFRAHFKKPPGDIPEEERW
ncbi:MAG: hypothetical protein EOP50_21480 [Sphingobacteriales bacterium]|nr:MAG: hypothetical protein EOP50_21480 [Sphingobacteriales bacterium]